MYNFALLRNAPTQSELDGNHIGSPDEPLCSEGREIALKAREHFKEKDFKPACVFVTPLLSTIETASIIFPGVPQNIRPNLREMDTNFYKNVTVQKLSRDKNFSEYFDAWHQKHDECDEEFVLFYRRIKEATAWMFGDIPRIQKFSKFMGGSLYTTNDIAAAILHNSSIMALIRSHIYDCTGKSILDFDVDFCSGYDISPFPDYHSWMINKYSKIIF